jgi:hypothetical protein
MHKANKADSSDTNSMEPSTAPRPERDLRPTSDPLISSEDAMPPRYPPLTFPRTNRVGGSVPPADWDWTKGPFPSE